MKKFYGILLLCVGTGCFAATMIFDLTMVAWGVLVVVGLGCWSWALGRELIKWRQKMRGE